MIDIYTLVRENVKHLKPYSSARDEFIGVKDNKVFLDANENPYENGLNRYPDPQQLLVKKKLASIKKVSYKQILLGNGSDEIIDLLFRAFCEPHKDNVLLLPPTYGMYKVSADINAVKAKAVMLTDNFQPNIEEILETANSETKILFLCSPNNPSGNSFNAETVEILLNEFKGLVFIDEAYIDFSIQESWLNRLEEFPNLIVTQTFSKAFGMAGIRLGICYASKSVITILNKIKPPYNVNELTQQKALKRLNEFSIIEEEVNQIKENRKNLLNELNSISIIKNIFPTDANFVLVRIDDAEKRYKELTNMGVVVRNRSSQPLCDNCLRLTIGTREENKKLINALKAL